MRGLRLRLTCVYNLDVRVDERAEASQTVVSGPPGAVAERLAGFFTAFNFLPAGSDSHEQMERLARAVM